MPKRNMTWKIKNEMNIFNQIFHLKFDGQNEERE